MHCVNPWYDWISLFLFGVNPQGHSRDISSEKGTNDRTLLVYMKNRPSVRMVLASPNQRKRPAITQYGPPKRNISSEKGTFCAKKEQNQEQTKTHS